MRERRVVALDRHHRLPRLDPVAVVERADLEPVDLGAELEDRDRLVHPAEPRLVLLEDLHDDVRPPAVPSSVAACVVEVRVRVPAGAHLLDRKVEDLGASRSTFVAAPWLELEARGERRLGDLELRRRRLGGREAVLELVAGLRERLRDGIARVARHPAEDLGRGGDRADLRGGARVVAHALRREPCEHVADRRGGDERADQMSAAALVLLRRALAVLVASDRDVLGTVIRGELRPAQRERRRRERHEPGEQLLRDGAQPRRLADTANGYGGGDHRGRDAPALHRQPGRRQRALHLRQQRERLGETGRAAQERLDTFAAWKRFCADATSMRRPRVDRARPRRRPVHEHAVRQRHPAEADLLVAHRSSGYPAVARSARCRPGRRSGRPSADRAPSTATTGITSRTDDERKASSAPSSRSRGKTPSSTS